MEDRHRAVALVAAIGVAAPGHSTALRADREIRRAARTADQAVLAFTADASSGNAAGLVRAKEEVVATCRSRGLVDPLLVEEIVYLFVR